MADKKRWGDRRDGTLIRDIDALHYFTGLLYPNRCDNEAFLSERIDLTKAEALIQAKNAENPEFHYSVFHLIVVAMIKLLTLRPKMNRFIANRNFYQRKDISAAFVVKREFADNGSEGLAFLYAKPEDTLETLHEALRKQIMLGRSTTEQDSTSDSMDMVTRLPRFLSRAVADVCRLLDRYGCVPKSFVASDPYYSSVLLTNLGSLHMHSGYHHLTNWGTNSVFVAVGERKMRPFYDEQGNVEMKDSIDLGLTIDERLADGYYYSKSIRLLKHILENPELLELPMNQEVDF